MPASSDLTNIPTPTSAAYAGIKRKFDEVYDSRIRAWQEQQGSHEVLVRQLREAPETAGLAIETSGTNQSSRAASRAASRIPVSQSHGPEWARTASLNPNYVFSDEEDELAQDNDSFQVGIPSSADGVREGSESARDAPSANVQLDDDSTSLQSDENYLPPPSPKVGEHPRMAPHPMRVLADTNRRDEGLVSDDLGPAPDIEPATEFSAADYDDTPATLSTFTLVPWPETKTVVCTSCKPPFALWAHNILSHRKKWHTPHPKEHQLPLLLERISDLAELSKDVVRPVPGQAPRPFLNPPVPGARCPHCEVSFQAKKKVRAHLAEQHPEKEQGEEGIPTMVQFTGRALNRYFSVEL